MSMVAGVIIENGFSMSDVSIDGGTMMSGVTATDISVSGGTISSTTISGVRISDGTIFGGTISDGTISDATISNVTFSNVTFSNVKFFNVELSNVTFVDVKLDNVTICNDKEPTKSKYISGGKFSNIMISGCTVYSGTISEVKLPSVESGKLELLDVDSREKLFLQLKRHEGYSEICYKCSAGKRTIGYGHNLEAWPVPDIDEHSHLFEADASSLLSQDVKRVYEQVSERIPFIKNLDPVRAAVLINMAFNLGIKGLCGFKNTLKYVENGDYVSASDNMLKSKWASQVKGRAKELAEQMRTGQWT